IVRVRILHITMMKEVASPSESVRDRKSEVCFAKVEVVPTDAVRFTVRPLKNDSVKLSESFRNLNSEVCSTKFEADPIEVLRFTVRPLNNELERLSES